MKGHDEVMPQVAVEFLRHEIAGSRFAVLHSVHDEVDVVGERFDLWLVSRLYTVFDGQVVSEEDARKAAELEESGFDVA